MNSLGPVACNTTLYGSEQATYTDHGHFTPQQCTMTLLMLHRLAKEHASHLVYNQSSSVKSCLSLWTCSVLFQLMSTAGPLARCSDFNERNDLGGFFSTFFEQQKIGQRARKGNW